MDRSMAPGEDFFQYANGSWLKATPIPSDRSSEGAGDILEDLTNQRTADLIRAAAQEKAPAGSEPKKIGDFFSSFMDEEGIEAKGLKPLQPTLDRIAAIADRAGLAAVLGGTLRADVDALNATDLHTDNLFGLWVAQDLDAPTRYVPFLLQGGLGMPDRDYYLDPSPGMAEVRTAYESHIAKVLRLASVPDPEAKAGRIFALERAMAREHWTRLDTGDVRKGDNHWTRKEFETRAPGLDWAAYFTAAGLGQQADFVVWQPSAVTGLSALVGAESLETWKDYLTFHAIDRASDVLPKALVEEQFAFYGRVLSGTPELRIRWKRAVEATNDALGEAVGKLYVKRHFPPEEKARLEAMVRNILAAFGKRIDALPWMAPATKVQAKAKLAVLKVGVGYPDRWIDYADLEVVPGDAFGNAERAELFELRRNLRKLGQPVDRGEWVMTPQTVNAVNLPAMNAMNFPAAILQPPFFDPRRPEVMDYGATGATIGHEISHSFDDQGSQFDATGRLHNWWTKGDLEHFQASAEQLVKQFDAYRPFPDLAIKGRLTLGENIADVAGLAAAYDAYRLSQGGKEAPAIKGFSGDQQFFLSYAQSWREKAREPALRQQILTNAHAPAQYRADTVRNLDAWYTAFDVKPGQALYLAPKDRVRIW
jgi:predicted metalloendopeptidase